MFSGQDLPSVFFQRPANWFPSPADGAAPELPIATPMLREHRGGPLVACDWGAALTHCCEGLRSRAQRTTLVASANLTNEEIAFAAALAGDGLGLQAIALSPSPPRSGAERQIAEAWGDPAGPIAWQAPEESDIVGVFGEKAIAPESPLWRRLSLNRRQPRLGRIASSVPLLMGMANIIIASGWADADFLTRSTSGFAEYARSVAPCTTDRVAAETGLNAEEVWELALSVATGGHVSYGGVPTGDPQLAHAIANLALLTGHIGEPGTGICFDLATFNTFGGRFPGTIPEEAEALWIVATDGPEVSLERVRRAEFVVVQDTDHDTPLAQVADVFLPSTGWRGKEGSVLDGSGQLRLLKPRGKLPPAALTDFRIFQLVAQYWGCGRQFTDWSCPEAAFRLLRADDSSFQVSPDYRAIDAARSQPPVSQTDAGRRWRFLL